MENEAMKLAQDPVMWIIALLTIGVVVIQSVFMYRVTKKYSEDEKLLTKDEIKIALKSGAVTTIGPALAVFILALSMVSLLGGPITLMRIGIVGSASTEMTAASVGTAFAGVSLGTDEMTVEALATATLAMAVMSMGYLIFVPLMTRGLGKGVQKILYPEGNNKKTRIINVFFGTVFPVLFLGMLVLTQAANGADYVISMVASFIAMYVCNKIAKEKNIQWLKEWNMGIAVLAGLITGPVAHLFLG